MEICIGRHKLDKLVAHPSLSLDSPPHDFSLMAEMTFKFLWLEDGSTNFHLATKIFLFPLENDKPLVVIMNWPQVD